MAVNVPINFFANVDDAAKEFNKLTSILKVAAGAFAVNKIIDGLIDMTKEAAKSEVTLQRLAGAMRTTGSFSEQNLEAFKKYADQIAKTTKYDDDLILSQFAVAKTFRATNQEAVELVKAATNLSAVTGDDLATSTRMLGQTLDGTSGRIKEMIPALRNLTAEQLANGDAIRLINQLYGGEANRQLNTFSGLMEKVAVSFGDLKKAVGFLFTENDVIKEVMKIMISGFSELTKKIGETGDKFSFISDTIIVTVKSFAFLVQVGKVATNIFLTMYDILNIIVRRIGIIPELVKNLLKLDFSANGKVLDDFDKRTEELAKSTNDILSGYDSITEKALEWSESLTKVRDRQAETSKAAKETKNNFDSQNGIIRENLDLMRKFMAELEKKQKNPIDFLFTDDRLQGIGAKLGKSMRTYLTAGLGVLSQILSGKEGAKKLLSGAAESLGRAFLGVPGIGALFEQLAMGPEHVRAMVEEFARAVPDIISAVLESIPAVIEALTNNLDTLVERLMVKIAERSPDIALAIAKAMTLTMPAAIARGMAGFTIGLVEGASKFVGKLVEGAGRFIDELVKHLTSIQGGGIAGGGLPGAGIGAGIGSVIMGPIGAIGGAISGGGGGGISLPRLFKGGGESSSGQMIQIAVQIDRSNLATAIVDLKRYGYRLEPA